jgi:ribose 5-phosphate isomerase B
MMGVAIGGGHAGHEMKQRLTDRLRPADYDITDVGTHSTEPVEYPEGGFSRLIPNASIGYHRYWE